MIASLAAIGTFTAGFAFDYDDPDNTGIFYEEDGRETENLLNFRNSFTFFQKNLVILFSYLYFFPMRPNLIL